MSKLVLKSAPSRPPLWEDWVQSGNYYAMEDFQPRDLRKFFRKAALIVVAGAAIAGLWFGIAHAQERLAFALDPLNVEQCNEDQILASPHYQICQGKTRRFIGTQATREQKNRFLCHCIGQYAIWERRDP